ncbi:MAG: ATP-binding cassette domain-containing protein [Dehalococcoidia bacterium]|nr:ATP-binding cassette domain-containing protein [Dehalococcoidia bacterium]
MTALNVQQLALRARGLPDDAITFSVADGQIAALFGRPGSGIRQVMRAIAGLEPVGGGEVRVGDMPVHTLPANKRRIGLVQRDSALFSGSVTDNVAFGLKHAGWPKGDRGRRIAEVLELVGMTGAEDDPIEALTEGERARVILARAIAPKPAALLVESPTWFVPDVDKIPFRGRLREVFQSLEIPVLISTNDVQDAVGIADDLHVMHEGAVKQSGSVSRVLAGPNSIETAELVGYVTLIRGEVSDGWILEPGAGAIEFPTGFPLQGRARAMAHPAVMLGVPESSGLGCGVAGTLERVRAIGPTHLLDLRIGERTIEVRWEWDLNPPDGSEAIAVAVTPGTLRFFNEPNTPRPAGSDKAPAEQASAEPSSGPRIAAPAPAPAEEAPPADAGTSATEAETSTWTSSDDGASAPAGGEVESPQPAEAPPAFTSPPADDRSASREFTPSAGLMAEPPPASLDTPEITYTPRDASNSDADFLGGAAFPAPAPPRTEAPPPRPTASDAPAAPASSEDESDDDSVELMAPWLQVSRPARDDEGANKPPDPHRGMPLD